MATEHSVTQGERTHTRTQSNAHLIALNLHRGAATRLTSQPINETVPSGCAFAGKLAVIPKDFKNVLTENKLSEFQRVFDGANDLYAL